MNDPHEHELHDELAREMAGFEAARVTHPIKLEPATVGSVLAIYDGTDQDATVRALAAAAAARTGAGLTECTIDTADAADAILEAGRAHDLWFVPCPYRLDYTAIGAASLSPTLDLVLTRTPRPICLVRGPVDDPELCIQRPMVAVDVARHRKVDATALALALARGGGWLALLSIVDPSAEIHRAELVGRYLDPSDLSPESLGGLATARTGGLLAALQRGADAWDVAPRLIAQVGSLADEILRANTERGYLLVAGLDRDPKHASAQLARSLVLGSSLPVLLVPN
ncbi:MAG: hypothetical protein AAF628_05445 [Planctomycetota bacterium]